MPYEYLDDVAIADVQFRASGANLPDLFRAAADATMNTMIHNLDAIEPKEQRTFNMENDSLEMLLFDFLQEFVYYKDAKGLLLRAQDVRVSQHDGLYRLEARARGECLDPTRHEQGADVKAVTLHRFSVQQDEKGWTACIILDI